MTSIIDTVISVSTLNRYARSALESALPLTWVSGEVSNLTYAASGHVYFTLKDESAQLRCVMFRQRAQLLPFRLSSGDKVEVRGLASIYEPRGDFQLTAETLRHAGVGALFEAFERLRQSLAAEHLFDAERKRPIPKYPQRVAVITSPQAAALHDVRSTLARRAPHLEVQLFPVPVQGPDAAPAMVRALQLAAKSRCDVIILTRGGGGIEDLWAFNDELLARALAGCPLPVVTGIGHETDTTIADFVADLRAPTPTGAAELVTAAYVAVAGELAQLGERLRKETLRTMERRQQSLDILACRLVHPGERISRSKMIAAHLAERLRAAMAKARQQQGHAFAQLSARCARARPRLEPAHDHLRLLKQRYRAAWRTTLVDRRHRLDETAAHLTHLNPAAPLRRGYALVRDYRGNIVRHKGCVDEGALLTIEFEHDKLHAKVIDAGSP